MVKIAFFVEGQTERVFIEKFLIEYFGIQNIELEFCRYWGQKGVEMLGKRTNLNAQYYILIFDVGGDGNITSAVKERAEGMINVSGYKIIIALRDLFPISRGQKRDVIEAFNRLFEGYLFYNKIKLVLAIMEIEAWFLVDHNLFARITGNNSETTLSLIRERLRIDLAHDNSELYDHPSSIISKIYGLFGKSYKKRETDSYEIVYSIDYYYLCSSDDVLNKVTSWKYFLDTVDSCFIVN